MKNRSLHFSLIPAFSSGVLLSLIVSWVAPFSEVLILDIIYIGISFIIGFLLRQLLRLKISILFNLMFIAFTAIMLTHGQTILYKLVTYYYWGWTVAYLFGLLNGVLYNFSFNYKAVFAIIAGGSLVFLIDSNQFLTYITLLGLLAFLWLSFYRLSYKLFITLLAVLLVSFSFDSKIALSARQNKFSDLVIFSDYTRESKIDVTTWRGNYWYYINNQNRLSSVDDYLYHEPLVHPAMNIKPDAKRILILGGEFGGALKEVVKYPNIEKIIMLPADIDLLNKIKSNQLFAILSDDSWNDPRVEVYDEDIFRYMSETDDLFDVIISDLPDPNSLLHNQYYTQEFFKLCLDRLNTAGLMVTQAGSPYFATKAYYSIIKTMTQSGFNTVPYHNQILTLGEWGWVLGSKDYVFEEEIREKEFNVKPVKWINKEAMRMMLSFGKITVDTSGTKLNTIKNPVTFKYYTAGNWVF